MFCGGTLVVDVRVICYFRVRERTSHSGSSSYCWPRRGCMGGCIRYRDETCSRETILLAGESCYLNISCITRCSFSGKSPLCLQHRTCLL